MKTCNKCGEAKEFSEFYKSKISKDGYRSECKTCNKERERKLKKSPLMQLKKAVRSSIYIENKILLKDGKRLCSHCKNIFLIANMNHYHCKECHGNLSKEYCEKNKDYVSTRSKEYREKNKEKIKKHREENKEKNKEYAKEYREKNKEKIKEHMKEYNKQNKEKIKEQKRQYRLKLKEGI